MTRSVTFSTQVFRSLGYLLAALLLSLPVAAQEGSDAGSDTGSDAQVETKGADVSVLEGGKARRQRGKGAQVELKVGSKIAEGDLLTTDEGARVELKFPDKSVLRIGSKAKVPCE